jgi:anti-sigma B factor antagonist
MNIDVENKDNGAILHLDGKIIGDGVARFKQAIEEQINSNINWLILDLSEVPLMDSSALGTIIMAFLRLKERKGKIVLLYAQKSILEVLNITKLDTLFEIYDNMQMAIDAVKINQ